jgi:hypothetical protein
VRVTLEARAIGHTTLIRLTRAIHGARPSGQLRGSLRHPASAVGTFSRQRERENRTSQKTNGERGKRLLPS